MNDGDEAGGSGALQAGEEPARMGDTDDPGGQGRATVTSVLRGARVPKD